MSTYTEHAACAAAVDRFVERASKPTCPCGCYVEGVKLFTRQHWKLTRIEDRGAREYYRYHVTGVNLLVRPSDHGREIHWQVPTLDNREYDTSEAELVRK